MSLYEQFFSDINKDFMFNMANNVLQKDHNIDIQGDEGVKEVYLKDMQTIFEENDFEDLSDINKLLLDTTIKKNKGGSIEENNETTEEEQRFTGYRKIEEDSSEKNDKKLADLMKERETVIIPKEKENEKEGDGEGTSIDSLLKKATGTKIETIIDENETTS